MGSADPLWLHTEAALRSMEKVLAILAPTQEGVPKSARKNSDKYLKDGVKVEIS